ncbi:MAG TPA: hypothetical protein VIT92_04285 [Burkholderiaceae bacterium]
MLPTTVMRGFIARSTPAADAYRFVASGVRWRKIVALRNTWLFRTLLGKRLRKRLRIFLTIGHQGNATVNDFLERG